MARMPIAGPPRHAHPMRARLRLHRVSSEKKVKEKKQLSGMRPDPGRVRPNWAETIWPSLGPTSDLDRNGGELDGHVPNQPVIDQIRPLLPMIGHMWSNVGQIWGDAAVADLCVLFS